MTHAHLRAAQRWRRRPGRTTGTLAAALGLALVLALPGAALAAPGDLDPAFGADGRVVTSFPGFAEGHDIARQADGKLVVVGLSEGGFALARYDTNGSLDSAFAGDGTVTSDFGGGSHSANAVAIQPSDGKIVVAGTTEVVAEEGGGCCFFSVARYNTDGSPDTGFGDGGLVRVDEFGGSADGADVAVQPDGKIIAAGKGGGGGFALVRLDAAWKPGSEPRRRRRGGRGVHAHLAPGQPAASPAAWPSSRTARSSRSGTWATPPSTSAWPGT